MIGQARSVCNHLYRHLIRQEADQNTLSAAPQLALQSTNHHINKSINEKSLQGTNPEGLFVCSSFIDVLLEGHYGLLVQCVRYLKNLDHFAGAVADRRECRAHARVLTFLVDAYVGAFLGGA